MMQSCCARALVLAMHALIRCCYLTSSSPCGAVARAHTLSHESLNSHVLVRPRRAPTRSSVGTCTIWEVASVVLYNITIFVANHVGAYLQTVTRVSQKTGPGARAARA